MVRRTFLLAAVLALPMMSRAADAPKPLVKGDRVVFLGDSITAAGARKTGYITLVQNTLTEKLPDLEVKCIGAGISGHKVPNLQSRLDRDVIAKKPTIVFIYIGINDVWHWRKQKDGSMKGGTTKEQFGSGLKDLIARIRAVGARVILCTPSTIGEKHDGSNERDKMLEEYADISRAVAAETKVQLNDLRKAFLAYEKEHNTENKPKGILTGDGVHLNAKGNQFVATQMLNALGVK
ncbi:SGNH/GDSL hydrolase family protein [bacterium]|nr:SGNH/GDSL hydrolase family protein [bacterium]